MEHGLCRQLLGLHFRR